MIIACLLISCCFLSAVATTFIFLVYKFKTSLTIFFCGDLVTDATLCMGSSFISNLVLIGYLYIVIISFLWGVIICFLRSFSFIQLFLHTSHINLVSGRPTYLWASPGVYWWAFTIWNLVMWKSIDFSFWNTLQHFWHGNLSMSLLFICLFSVSFNKWVAHCYQSIMVVSVCVKQPYILYICSLRQQSKFFEYRASS